jgi:hypothetical protein
MHSVVRRNWTMQKLLLAIALALGGLIAYIDSSPGWDDTGVIVGVIFIASCMLGVAGPHRPWLWALALGIWIPLLEIVKSQNYGSLLALAIAFAGAYTGLGIRRALLPT